MLERLCDTAKEELRLGLVTPAIARQLTRLPMGNQADALHTTREASLTSTELSQVVDLLLANSSGFNLPHSPSRNHQITPHPATNHATTGQKWPPKWLNSRPPSIARSAEGRFVTTERLFCIAISHRGHWHQT